MSCHPIKARILARGFPPGWRLVAEKDGEGWEVKEEGKGEREAPWDLEVAQMSCPLSGVWETLEVGGGRTGWSYWVHLCRTPELSGRFYRSSVLWQVGPAHRPWWHQDWHEGVPEVWHQRDREGQCLKDQPENLRRWGANRKVRQMPPGLCNGNDTSQFPHLFSPRPTPTFPYGYLYKIMDCPPGILLYRRHQAVSYQLCLIKGVTIRWATSF